MTAARVADGIRAPGELIITVVDRRRGARPSARPSPYAATAEVHRAAPWRHRPSTTLLRASNLFPRCRLAYFRRQ